MTPHQLDIILHGAFIYERPDGSRYASFSYKHRDWGAPMVGRTGPLTVEDIEAGDILARLNARMTPNEGAR